MPEKITSNTRPVNAGSGCSASEPLVSVVLLSYARPHCLDETLASVVEQSYPNLEIIVVDNWSDQSEEIARIVARYPQVRLIRNSVNLGFTGGMNLGIRACRGDYIYLTEDDMVLERGCVREFVCYTQKISDDRLLSGLTLNKADGLIWCAGGIMKLASVFQMKILGKGECDSGQFTHPFDVNFIPGSKIFAPSRLLKELGGFREDFFMYWEDVELCLRAAERNCRITIVPSARSKHFQPANGPSSERIEFHKMKNGLALYMLHAKPQVLAAYLLRTVATLLRSRPKRALLWLSAIRATVIVPNLWRERHLRYIGRKTQGAGSGLASHWVSR